MSMKIRLHHIGIAVKALSETRSVLEKIPGINFLEEEEVDSQKVKVAYADMEAGSIELIQATDKHSPLFPIMDHPILSFIKKHDEGLHHICFQVDSLEKALSGLKDSGIRTLGEGIMEGSSGEPVIFLDPNDCKGLLIELRE
jgi:methylmalonyl-CoA/ethylmalonyl-CoA epimerase